ncbi:MAG TPA: alpha/beta hydrolase-fold protein, partial [Bacteroidales bacterium]|nr:alpha/beta hydrolase-fold protein [Bacteroidales bacterium]
QNLFDEKFGYGGMTWGVDEVLTVLQRLNKVEPTIVVGVWNTSERWREYMPQKPFESLSDSLKARLRSEQKGAPMSDAYLKFLVKELKPFVDKKYNTLPDKENTIIMGSSMGGLISWYAACEYPEVFGAAGCVSTHWPGAVPEGPDEIPQAFFSYLENRMKPVNNQRIYFDFGTETLDAFYEPLQKRADSVMRRNGFEEGKNWITRKFVGHRHDEASWNKRLHVPVLFLMGSE